jgi:hypothetical protein
MMTLFDRLCEGLTDAQKNSLHELAKRAQLSDDDPLFALAATLRLKDSIHTADLEAKAARLEAAAAQVEKAAATSQALEKTNADLSDLALFMHKQAEKITTKFDRYTFAIWAVLMAISFVGGMWVQAAFFK